VAGVVRSTSAGNAKRSTFNERFTSAVLGSCGADSAFAETTASRFDSLEAALASRHFPRPDGYSTTPAKGKALQQRGSMGLQLDA